MSISSTTAFCLRLAKPQAADQPFVLALGGFAVDEQSKPLFEGQCCDVGLSLLFVEWPSPCR